MQERGTVFPAELNYDNVDLVIFVGPHILEECVEKFKMPRDKVCVIGNFLDFKKYDRSKFGGTEFNLGVIGIVPSRKRLDLAVDTLRYLLEKDSRYMLHLKGPSPQSYNWLWARTKEREYYQEIFHEINSSNDLRHKIVFDPAGSDVDSWLQKIGYLLSPSDFESFHMAVAEGMCSGAVPIVWNWEGASSIYPLLELANNPKEAAELIHILATSNSRQKLSTQSKQFIQDNYDTDLIMSKWVNALLPSSQLTLSTSVPPNAENKNIIIVYAIDSWEAFHRREMLEALAENIKGKAEILIIEPGSHYKTLLDKQICSEIELNDFAKLKPCKVNDNISRIRILQGSMPESAGAVAKLKNAGSYEKAIQVAVQHIFGSQASIVHWIYKPDQKKWVYGNQPYIYEVYDEYTMDFSTGVIHQSVADAEPEVLRNAAHVFFTSEPLAERKKTSSTSWSIIGNGVAFDIFEKFRCKSVPQIGMRKSIGYLGNLSDFFDWELMVKVCKRMPDCDFFFHGQVEHHRLETVKDHVEQLLSMSNTYFSGRITRAVGAAAINRYDALIIPFVVNDAMHAVNPLKLWEYFATGKPVVSTPMDAIKIGAPLLRVANGAEHWVDELNQSINEDNVQHSLSRVALARNNSWQKLTTNHVSILLGSI